MKSSLNTSQEVKTGYAPEGAHPAKQMRSRLLRDSALIHASKLIQEGRYASTSMSEIARAIGCSVGALYFRFRDKEALFACVVEIVLTQEVEELKILDSKGRYQDLSLRKTVEQCVLDYVEFIERHQRMIRAMYQSASKEPTYWDIVRLTAFKMVQIWMKAMAHAAGAPNDKYFLRKAGKAFWFVSSTLVYSVLIIGKPVHSLHKHEQVFWLTEMVIHFIGLHIPAHLQASTVTRPVNTVIHAPSLKKRPIKQQGSSK
jgi:AcrR family transcriptional regulator